jgi:hypothetical protein
MKNMKLFTIAITLIILISCNKKIEQVNSTIDPFMVKMEQYQMEENPSTKKMMYRLFSENEKARFWKSHFEIALKKEKFSKVGSQLLIKEIMNIVQPEIFIEGSNENNLSKAYYMPIWTSKAEKLLNNSEIAELVYFNYWDLPQHIYNSNNKEIIKRKIALLDPDAEKPVDCFCHVNQNGFSCRKTEIDIGIPNTGFKIVEGKCEQAQVSCSQSDYGCGWLWGFSCNGSHCNFG